MSMTRADSRREDYGARVGFDPEDYIHADDTIACRECDGRPYERMAVGHGYALRPTCSRCKGSGVETCTYCQCVAEEETMVEQEPVCSLCFDELCICDICGEAAAELGVVKDCGLCYDCTDRWGDLLSAPPCVVYDQGMRTSAVCAEVRNGAVWWWLEDGTRVAAGRFGPATDDAPEPFAGTWGDGYEVEEGP